MTAPRWTSPASSRRSRRCRSSIRRSRNPAASPSYPPGVGEPIYGVVPNFSEGRRADVMDAICDALQVPGARLVYRQADADHNRLDTTVLGSRDGFRRAAVPPPRVAVVLTAMERHGEGTRRRGPQT